MFDALPLWCRLLCFVFVPLPADLHLAIIKPFVLSNLILFIRCIASHFIRLRERKKKRLYFFIPFLFCFVTSYWCFCQCFYFKNPDCSSLLVCDLYVVRCICIYLPLTFLLFDLYPLITDFRSFSFFLSLLLAQIRIKERSKNVSHSTVVMRTLDTACN